MHGYGHWGWDGAIGYGWWWGHAIGWMFMILLWALIILIAAALVRWAAGGGRLSVPYRNAALEILRERYAKGEIEREEFQQKKKDLEG